ncbi:MAG: endonuclease/exonuclease/phosphatase family protein [Myxococcota bacterium]
MVSHLATLLLALSSISGSTPAAAERPEGLQLRVVTYNVNFGRAGDMETLAAIGDAEADLIALQETNPHWEQEIRRAYGQTYPHMAFFYAGAASGLALLSKLPFEHEIIENPGPWFPAMLAVVGTREGPVQVLNLHLRPPISDGGSWVSGQLTTRTYRRDEAEEFGRRLDPEVPALIVGDFNERSGHAIRYFRSLGARDAVADMAGSTHTWRWPLRWITLRKQLDHVLHTEHFVPLDLEVREVGRSDHLPIMATFVLVSREQSAAF